MGFQHASFVLTMYHIYIPVYGIALFASVIVIFAFRMKQLSRSGKKPR